MITVVNIIILSSIIHLILTNRIKMIIHFIEYMMSYELAWRVLSKTKSIIQYIVCYYVK